MMKRDNEDPTVEQNRRKDKERRDESHDRRQEDRRIKDRRTKERRVITRRKEFCPTCGERLTPTLYCKSCKARFVKIG